MLSREGTAGGLRPSPPSKLNSDFYFSGSGAPLGPRRHRRVLAPGSPSRRPARRATRASSAAVQTATGVLPGLITSSPLVRLLEPGRRLRSSPAPRRSDGSLSTAWSLLLDSRAVGEGLGPGRPPRLKSSNLLHGGPSPLCCRGGGAA